MSWELAYALALGIPILSLALCGLGLMIYEATRGRHPKRRKRK
jgi:hypothetical protein